MKIEEDGNILTISDKPYLRWAIGTAIFLFSLLLVYIGISLLFHDSEFGINYGLIVSGLIFGYFGSRLVWKYPQISCEIDSYTKTLTYTKVSVFGRTQQIHQLAEIKKAEIANKQASLDGEGNDGKFRVELLFRNSTRLPVASRWRLSDYFCQEVADKINSSIPKLNQRKREKPGIWKD